MSRLKTTTEEEKTLTSILNLCGLSDKESKIYWILVNRGVLSGVELVQKSGFKKGNTYALLHQLEKKGLILSIQRERKTYFQPEPPKKVLDLLERKNEETQQSKGYFERILPRLSSRYKLSINKPIIQYYEGEEGIYRIFEDIYAPKKEPVYGCGDLDEADKSFPNYIADKLIPKRIRNKLLAKSFFSYSKQAVRLAKQDKEQIRETVLLDRAKYPLPAEIDVYEDKIAMLSFKKNEFVGVLIENKDIATSLKSIFKRLHELLHNRRLK